jgi:hypothetical protein
MAWRTYRSGNKYHNKKITIDGVTSDSKKEARRFQELKILEKAGQISKLERQVKFTLIPAQREPDIIGARGGRKPGKLIERECAYFADFAYIEKQENGEKVVVVEDTKGMKTPEYIIKRKLMLYRFGIRIREI